MTEENAVKMAHFRYGVICSLLAESYISLKKRIEELAHCEWTLPCGLVRSYAAATIEDWYYDYRKFGFDALINPPRKDKNVQRSIPDNIIAEIERLFREFPGMKNSNIIRLLDSGGFRRHTKPSDATFYRYLKKVRRLTEPQKAERRAFEAARPAALYQTDLMYGPVLKIVGPDGRTRNQKTYLIAIIDDFSRVICAAQFFTDQGLMSYLTVLEKALRSRGIPDKIYCDNGQIFISSQVQRIGAELGMRVVRAKVRDAAAKGKIERFFRTVRDQFLDCTLRVEGKKIKTVDDINRHFRLYLENYNSREHSAIGCSPRQRWLQSPHQPRFPAESLHIDTLFMLEAERKIKKDGTISIENLLFELSSANSGQKVKVRYTPQDLSRVHAFLDGEYLGVFYPLNRQGNDGLPRKSGEQK